MENELFKVLKRYENGLRGSSFEVKEWVIIFKLTVPHEFGGTIDWYAFLHANSPEGRVDFKYRNSATVYSNFLIENCANSPAVIFKSGKVVSCERAHPVHNGEILLKINGNSYDEQIYIHYSQTGEELFKIHYMFDSHGFDYTKVEKALAKFEKKWEFYNPKNPSEKSVAFLANNNYGFCLYDIYQKLWLIDPEGNDFRNSIT